MMRWAAFAAFKPLGRATPLVVDAAALLARAIMAYVFIVEGYGKIAGYADVGDYMEQYGVSARLLPLVIATELGGGLLVLGGLLTRWAAIALAGFSALAALLFHRGGDANQAIEFGKDIGLAGGFLALAIAGPGAWSVDSWLARRSPGAAPPR